MTASALDVWDVYDRLGWSPHEGQEAVASSPARNRVVAAGRRFGKSDIGGHELVPEALFTYNLRTALQIEGRRREFWIVGPEYSDSEKEFRVAYNSLKALEVPFDRPGTYYDPIGGNMHISLWDGTFQVHAKSARHPEQLVGEGLHGVILSEAAKLQERVWVKYIRPTLADYQGWSLMASTPEGKNWFYDLWQAGQDPNRPDWDSWKFPSWKNPYVYRSFTDNQHVKRLQKALREREYPDMSLYQIVETFGLDVDPEIISLVGDLTEAAFNQEIGADFTEFVGRVFKEFDEEIHVTDLEWQPKWDTVAAVDYGFRNPNVWLVIQIGPWGQIHVFDELYESGLTALEFGKEVKARGLDRSVRTFFPDPASPGDTRQVEETLRIRSTGGTGGELKHRLDSIRRALRRVPELAADGNPDKLPQLRINRRCTNTVREFLDYRYPEKRKEASGEEKNKDENPMKKDDHTPEALGRFFQGYFGTLAQQAGGPRKHRANYRR